MPKICKRTLICLEKKKINSFALLVHEHPSTLFIVHPPTPNNRYNNALKIIRNNSSKAATLKKTIAFVQKVVVYLGILREC